MVTSGTFQQKAEAAHSLLTGGTTTREKFESVRTLLKGYHPRMDRILDDCSRHLARYEKVHKGEVIELSAEHLPEHTEEDKKKKRLLLLFIRSWKELRSEVDRVQQERDNDKNQSPGQKVWQWGKIVRFAKGPFGILTIAAVLIVAVTSLTKQPALQPANVQVIIFEGKKIPLSEIQPATGPECDRASHYHAKNHGVVKATDGSMIPDPGGCGYGKVAEVTHDIL